MCLMYSVMADLEGDCVVKCDDTPSVCVGLLYSVMVDQVGVIVE